MNTSIEIIKAFARSQVSEISPNASQLIQDILGTLTLKKRIKERSSKLRQKKQNNSKSREVKK